MLKQGDFASHIRKILIGCMVAVPLVLIGGAASLRVSYLHQVEETARIISPVVLLVGISSPQSADGRCRDRCRLRFYEEDRAEVDTTRRVLQRATRASERAEKSLAVLEEQRRKVFDAHKTHAQHIKDVAEGLIEAYRTANLERDLIATIRIANPILHPICKKSKFRFLV